MWQKCLLSATASLFLHGCQDEHPTEITELQTIHGRNRKAIYRAFVPNEWLRVDPSETISLDNTMEPLVTYEIHEGKETVQITIHNFPTEKITERIPPQAQVARWGRQLEGSESQSFNTPVHHSGFYGLYFEGEGVLKGTPTYVSAWAMSLHGEHYRAMNDPQKRADWTIKATGPKELVLKSKEKIQAFAQSFELIEEIPPE